MKKMISLFAALTLIACATPEQRKANADHAAHIQNLVDEAIPETYVSISCVGHADAPVTAYSIQDLETTDEYGGGNCGGTNAAGYPLPKQWRPGMKVTVRWKLDRQPWRETTTNIMRYDSAEMLFIHIFNNNQVRVVSAFPYPSSTLHPIPFRSKIPPPEEQ